ncbi:MAG: hypothetical protein A2070_09475 [Bdellovibrionales bacterium GWC1_52_8]|nr:MAG: hypothetical protein A2Z97_08760 [Bdellovibrionales bacterium GWB1_52_6]OFZ06340.1 MAG: hypothetical protein A2X97_02650 [Bdellovibrionales bacterium GWA1_52_35]OFZ36563.1 MAG: hypothetical protein A2070_09475 [Bdellovibrionales bacterium GWC1_52_8]
MILKKLKKARRGERGQASIFIGLMLMTFLLFFAFVVNTGMLVNAKINLQNAADLAAYSGAAQQARTLNQISFLNYEMRRAYKKFLFRYYVLGNMAQKSFPRSGGSGPMLWSPDGSTDYQVPAVCMIFNGKDNYCQIAALQKINAPPANPLDAITTVLRAQLLNLEKLREQNCASIAKANTFLLMLWMYNTDPSFASVDPKFTTLVNLLKNLAGDLGLIPRELLLSFRIKTLEKYLNAAPQVGVDIGKVRLLRSAPDPIAQERTVNAFLSAYNTLGENSFASDSIFMDELIPTGNKGASLIKLNEIKAAFDVYAVDFEAGSGNSNNPKDCTTTLQAISTPESGLTLGFYKDPQILTYYAVRLKAKAKVMFSPFGDMELKAYAAAQPFGSRIGPPLPDDSLLVRKAIAKGKFGADVTIRRQIPNLPVQESDSAAGAGKGWDNQEIMSQLYKSMQTDLLTPIQRENFERGYHAAMGPNPWEGTRYNILNDTVPDPFMVNFDTQKNAALWAPIFPPDEMAGLSSAIKGAIHEFFAPPSGSGMAASAGLADLEASLSAGLSNYIDQLNQGRGEEGEGLKVVKITDPFTSRPNDPANAGIAAPLGSLGGMLMTDPSQYRTSWSAVPNHDAQAMGRIGYSVKFVSFHSLLNASRPADGKSGNPNNRPDGGADGDEDFIYLKH